MARTSNSKIDERLDQHRRADARRKWESAVKAADCEYATVASEPVDALSERFNTLERSINLLRRENVAQAAAFLRYRNRTRLHLVAATLIAAIVGAVIPQLMSRIATTLAVNVADRR